MKKIIPAGAAILALLSTLQATAVTVTKKNCISMLSGKPEEKIAALQFIGDNQFKKAAPQVLAMIDREDRKGDVFHYVLLANGRLQNTKATKKIQDIYEGSSDGAVRFTCVLALLEMQDISSLRFVRKAHAEETDRHTKEVLAKVIEILDPPKKK